jgi:hypothetical protein
MSIAVSGAGALAVSALHRVGVHQGYAPEQPIAFSHTLHAGRSKIPCGYCHFAATRSRHAGIPPLNVCMNCHSLLQKRTRDIERLKEAVQQGRAIRWIRVHALPDFVYFNHSQHVLGGVECRACHGAVESMERVRQDAPLTMGWCIDCHRRRAAVAATESVRRVRLDHDETARREAPGPSDTGHAPSVDCGRCHY